MVIKKAPLHLTSVLLKISVFVLTPSTQISGARPSPFISPLSLSSLSTVVPCVQLTFSPKRPPLFVWNCYANVEMLLVSLCLASYQLWWVGGGGESNTAAPPPPNQIRSLYRYTSLIPPIASHSCPAVEGKRC